MKQILCDILALHYKITDGHGMDTSVLGLFEGPDIILVLAYIAVIFVEFMGSSVGMTCRIGLSMHF